MRIPILGCVAAAAAILALPALSAPGAAYKAKFYVSSVKATKAGAQTKVTLAYRIDCPGTKWHAGIGFANSSLDVYTIKNGWVSKSGTVSKSFTLAKGAYTASAAEVRCYKGSSYVGGAFPPKNPGSQKTFQVR